MRLPRAAAALTLAASAVAVAVAAVSAWSAPSVHGSVLAPDAPVVWVTLRPPSEVIPPGADLMRISVHRGLAPRHAKQQMLSVTSSRRIMKVIALLNALPAAQQGLRNCPADFGIYVRFVFFAGRRGAPVAAANVYTTGCEGVTLTIGGAAQPRLQGGAGLVQKIDRVLGVKLDIGRQ